MYPEVTKKPKTFYNSISDTVKHCCSLHKTLIGLCQPAHIYEENNLKYVVLNRVCVICTLCSQHIPGALNKSVYLAALP